MEIDKPALSQGSSGDELGGIPSRLEEELGPQLPLALSIDGRTFTYESPLSKPLGVGSYVAISIEGGPTLLGQILTEERAAMEGPEYGTGVDAKIDSSLTMPYSSSATRKDTVKIWYLQGRGELLGTLTPDECAPLAGRGDIFQDAAIEPADSRSIIQFFEASAGKYTLLTIGIGVDHHQTFPVRLTSAGFTRHTFLCGQSGSGKSFALSVILEQLLLHTRLNMVILDPNSDFVGLKTILPFEAVNNTRTVKLSDLEYEEIEARHQEMKNTIGLYRPDDHTNGRAVELRIRFWDLKLDEQAAILQLHPIDDREEFFVFSRLPKSVRERWFSGRGFNPSNADRKTRDALVTRVVNLGVGEWKIWQEPIAPSLFDALDSDDRCTVVDLGKLASPTQRAAVAMAVLGRLWRNPDSRKPTLVVIDEAHNICPHHPSSDLEAKATDYVIRMAGEGRKFGLHLLLVSQRPGKIHPNILSEVDNLVLMRMNSRSDLEYLEGTFGQVPLSFLRRATTFTLGEALLSGDIVGSPTFAKFEGRLTHEGGGDPPKDWALKGIDPPCHPNPKTKPPQPTPNP